MKQFLLKNELIWQLNRMVKSIHIEKRYKKILRKYSRMDNNKSIYQLLDLKGWNKFDSSNLRIVYMGTDYYQDFGGFNQALSELFDAKFFYQYNGVYGQYSGKDSKKNNTTQLLRLLDKWSEEDFEPDILLMQSFGFNIDVNEMIKIKKKYNMKIINIGMDERLSYELGYEDGFEKGISGLNSVIDAVFVTTPECVDWYMKEGVPAYYFPLASNPDIYFPIEGYEKKYDVGFIGRKYGIRGRIVEYLISNGINVKAYGPGWDSGTLDISENNDFYNSCKIVLGTGNIGYSYKLMNPKLRDYEVPLSGVLYITNYSKELSLSFEQDKEIVFYNGKEELLMKINYYLKNSCEREKIAELGYIKAVNNHTYNKRLSYVFNKLSQDVDLIDKWV